MGLLKVQRSSEEAKEFASRIPELLDLERMLPRLSRLGTVQVEAIISHKGLELPIYSLAFGSSQKEAPTVVFVGGVHGLERIGSRVIIEYLKTFKELLYWDKMLEFALSECRVLFYPIANPVGVFERSRCNGNGVDLMRNAPIDSPEASRFNLVSGHRLSPRLPWYRGYGVLEKESDVLCNFIRREVFPAEFSMSLDMHSGFGRVDRLWFPYARSREVYRHYVELYALKRKLDQALPNHVYQMEPQSHQYVTHGDLWDFLDLERVRMQPDRVFLPLTLEMGSWSWVRKNPWQLTSTIGPFHPVVPHRTRRTLRRHVNLIDFLIRATVSHKKWNQPPRGKKQTYEDQAKKLWYG